jgi:hypothetical protein
VPRAVEVPVPGGLHADLLLRFGTHAEALRAAKLGRVKRPPSARRRWTRKRVLDELRRLHQLGVPITVAGIADCPDPAVRGLHTAIVKHVGGIERARALAGIPDPERATPGEWSPNMILTEIRLRHRRNAPLAWSRVPYALRRAAARAFGNWGRAIVAAGIDNDRVRLVRRPYIEGELIDDLRRLARRQPTMTASGLSRRSLSRSAERMFGSVPAALTAAGIVGWPRARKVSVYSSDETIRRVRARHAAGRPMQRSLVFRDDPRLARAVGWRFGTWRDGMTAAGVPYVRARRVWTRRTVLAALRARADAGHSMSSSVLDRDDRGLLGAAIKRFGTYARVLDEVGVKTRFTRWSSALVIREMRRHVRRGLHASAEVLPDTLQYAARRFFGSLDEARAAAGIRFAARTRGAARTIKPGLSRLAR